MGRVSAPLSATGRRSSASSHRNHIKLRNTTEAETNRVLRFCLRVPRHGKSGDKTFKVRPSFNVLVVFPNAGQQISNQLLSHHHFNRMRRDAEQSKSRFASSIVVEIQQLI